MTNSISPDSTSPNLSGESGVVGGSGRTQPAAPALLPTLGRSVKEWVAENNDEKIPDRVRVRVFERYGKKCNLCGRAIRGGDTWICDHIKALINGGEHREINLHPICDWCDKNIKTPADVAEKSATYKSKLKTYGLHKSKKPMPGGRKSREKKTIDGRVIDRITGEQIWPRINS